MAAVKVVDAMRSSLELEFIRADRLDSRARGEMTLGAAWFATVQAVVTISLKPGTAAGWGIAIGAAALVATAALAVAALGLSRVWRPRPDLALTQETLGEVARALRSPAPSERCAEEIVKEYEHLVAYAQARNAARLAALKGAAGWWWAALACAMGELVLGLAARLALL